ANDIFRKSIAPKLKITEAKSGKIELLISRYSTFLVIFVGIWIAWSPPEYLSVFMWIGIGGIVSASAGPLVVGALWQRSTKTGAILSLIAGTIVYWVVYLPFGFDFSNPFGAAGIGVLVSMIVMIVYTLTMTEKVPKDVIEGNV